MTVGLSKSFMPPAGSVVAGALANAAPPVTGVAVRETLQRQFVFIEDGRLQDAPTVRQLLRHLEPVRTREPSQRIMARFSEDAALYALPVLDDEGKPVALVDRKHFMEFFSKPFSQELFRRRSVRDLIEHKEFGGAAPIVVDEGCSIEDVAQIILASGMHHMLTGFLVCSAGRYEGMANGHDLLNMITQRKQAELYYMAHYDHLTGIPNRILLADRIEQACREAERNGDMLAVLFIDVDRFKHINDSLGHSAGDEVLRKVVERITASARRSDTVARLAGDEFVILMENVSDPSLVELVATRLVKAMRAPIEVAGHSVVATVSIGSAIYPHDETRVAALITKADAAMYEAKARGRNGYRRYTTATTVYNPAIISLEAELRKAIEQEALELHYQPLVHLADGSVFGVEALARWQHPQRGRISPAQFIQIAEESGLIISLGEWALRHALRRLKTWNEAGVPPLRMSINISALQLQRRGFPDFLGAQMRECGVDPRYIELELTETALMHDIDEVMATLNKIKALGVSLAIDDFGTGFSSLSYLRRFPVDRLKIDQSFVRGIESAPVNESIARAIVALAKSLSLDIIAEGIETPLECAVLQRIGCREGQGYLFGRPMAEPDLLAYLGAGRAPDPAKAAG